MPHAVLVFDLDGTLGDLLEGIARPINHALRTHGRGFGSPAELQAERPRYPAGAPAEPVGLRA